MSSTQSPPPATQTPRTNEVIIYSHSGLFYWWPVWVVGFVLALLTYTQGTVLAVVPLGTEMGKVEDQFVLKPVGEQERPRQVNGANVLVLPQGKSFPEESAPHLRTSAKRSFGVVFVTVLMVVILITNVPLRGMWSVMIIMFVVLMSVILALAGVWDNILRTVSLLDIRINLGGYLFISVALLIIWLVTFLFFDRQLSISFQPGRMAVQLEIGQGRKIFSTIGMVIEKQRSDLFRHWILGLGSGDLIIRTAGADRHEFRLQNVLFIGRKLPRIEDMANRVPE
jgi:hypothetical protein